MRALAEKNLRRDGVLSDPIVGIAQIFADDAAALHARTRSNAFVPRLLASGKQSDQGHFSRNRRRAGRGSP